MFPYPSGEAHMGHIRVYTLADVVARYKRYRGFNTINPIGWDAFGLPAENAAIKNKVNPKDWTIDNINKMRSQFKRMGFSFDWNSEINTSSEEYFKWTQWLFMQLYKSGMIDRKLAQCNWCPSCQTVLANEQVMQGLCWRCDSVVELKEMEQWFIKITDYAEELDKDIEKLTNWPDSAKNIQKEWIGKKEGTVVYFNIANHDESGIAVEVFTTRVDTLFGVKAIVLAHDYEYLHYILEGDTNRKAAYEFIEEVKSLTEVDILKKQEIYGFKLQKTCIHPITKQEIPIYIGDYVLSSLGTGAVMCVPAHDKRDFRFAQKYGLEITEVIKHKDCIKEIPYIEHGYLVNSQQYNGLTSFDAMVAINDHLESHKLGRKTTVYKLKDWLISRQRYWGVPIPLLKDAKGQWTPVDESELPWNPFKTYEEWKEMSISGIVETDTMDTFMCSSWYFYRFVDSCNNNQWADTDKLNYWMPIDYYIGGLEHAAQHLIYARFLCKFLYKKNLIKFNEPVDAFFANGMVKLYNQKMSKSKGNIVSPTKIVEEYGADALRMYILGNIAPEFDMEWSDDGIASKYNFINKVWSLFNYSGAEIKDVSDIDIVDKKDDLYVDSNLFVKEIESAVELFSMHLVISKIHSFYNLLNKNRVGYLRDENKSSIYNYSLKKFLIVFSLIAPFVCEKIYQMHFNKNSGKSLFDNKWPTCQDITKETFKLPVQINGKFVDTLEVNSLLCDDKISILSKAIENVKIKKKIGNLPIKDFIYINRKILNIIT